MDKVFYVVFAKPTEENTSKENKNKDDNTWIFALYLARGVKR